MKKLLTFSLIAILFASGSKIQAQYDHVLMSPEYVISLTSKWTGDRLPDGRPKVSDNVLERLKKVVLTHAWGSLRGNGFNNQYQGNWMMIHEDKYTVMTGRVVTAQYMPKRPDFEEVIKKVGYAEGHSQLAGTNVWPIDILKNGDVYVGDGYGKIENGTLLGDRLANSIYAKSNNGIILWGSVRNIQEIRHVEGFNGWILADHPSAISEMMLTSINAPIRIGQTTVLPGDVAYATPFGTLFIPAYLASQVVLNAEISNLRHVYGIMRLKQGDWTTGMIDSRWTDQMTNEFHAWMQKQPDSELPMPRQELNDYIKSQKK